MNRAAAYRLLSDKLNALRAAGYDELLSRVALPADRETVELDGEPVLLEVTIQWADRNGQNLRLLGTAMGPSTWHTERLEETLIVTPTPPTEE